MSPGAETGSETATDPTRESPTDPNPTTEANPTIESNPTAEPNSRPVSIWRNRDFRRFFAGQFVTNAGDSLYTVAVLWLIFELSGSTALTGLANAILLLPWLLQILAGPVVDRLPLRPVLVGSQVAQGVVVLTLPLAAVTGHLDLGLIFAVVPLLMLSSLFMTPMEAALVPRIVDDTRLSKANSALATVTLGLDMVFDALGGILIAVVGTTLLFVLDAATFALAALCFAGIVIATPGTEDAAADVDADAETVADEERDGDSDNDSGPTDVLESYVDDLRDGVDVLRGTLFVELVATTALVNLAVGVTLAILPAVGKALGGPALYGLMLGALGIGRLVGSVLAPRIEGVPYGRFTLLSYTLAAGCWFASVYAPEPWLAVVLFGLAWIPAGVSGVLTATLNQTVFPTDLLGRVSTIKGTASGATLPLGSLLGGLVAEQVGTTTTMALAALGFGSTALIFLLRPRLRRLPAVADADPSDFDVVAPDEE